MSCSSARTYKAGGVFKATVGLYEQFGRYAVRDTPISEQAILGAAMGAAMTGLKPIAEIMFSDFFFAVCFDYIANEFPKSCYMSNGQTKCPLVVRPAMAPARASAPSTARASRTGA
jgi:pyruvate dehydrogenase E1 component beta subunit